MISLLARARARRTDRGASAVEYGLLVAGIAVVIISGIFGFAHLVNDSYVDSCDTIAAHTGQADC